MTTVDFNDETLCQNSGMCCHTELFGKVYSCKHLIDLGNDYTSCDKWFDNDRIGTVIARKTRGGVVKVSRCDYKRNAQYDYPGCLLNTDKPCFVEHVKKIRRK